MGNSILAAFADELSAHRYFERLLWPGGAICPHCRGTRVGRLDGASTRLGSFKCYGCRKIFSITYGTIFERSHVPLHKWLQALYLTSFGRQCCATDLARILNVTCKTAVTMLRRLEQAHPDRRLATERVFGVPLPFDQAERPVETSASDVHWA